MSRDRHTAALLPALVFVVTVVELVAAVVVPASQFEGKGWGVRLVVYPALMLLAPAVWWATRGRTGATDPPYAAFALLMLPFLSDTTANWLDLFRDVGWWDDLSHFAHWFSLGAGLALLLAPYVRPRWVLVPLVGGLGCLLALAWEVGEYTLFIRHGREAGGAYRDTLGDQALGTSGALLAALLVAWWTARPKRTLTG
ncbi:MAG TPA: hypothetical protein DEQ43_20055 [Nocardioides bacterium]|uniref:hypothetical protein n=1 Tax=uncultured Nocardioides sp. TaxID=198441 RepID=UPI000EE94886|nr:hypothetical protein [uncultured Nocardioides sp.]HCB06501.1 hypothetical protein [Nocardioides sp.]